jgi:hypothetical protein
MGLGTFDDSFDQIVIASSVAVHANEQKQERTIQKPLRQNNDMHTFSSSSSSSTLLLLALFLFIHS